MARLAEVRERIRFALEQLKIRNGFHEFEHLAREYARQRICKNILPATGPVSGGGDQGRDFETHNTHLENTSIFEGVSKNERIFFACSLQKEIIGKIKDDIKSIFSQTDEKRPIYYFCVEDVPIKKRNELKQTCKKDYGVDLEIFDGYALSELLSDADLFPIAIEYLNIPADIYPKPKQSADWYNEYKQHWITEDNKPQSFSDFCEIKYSIREATHEDGLKADLIAWIKAMRKFIASSSSLQRKAQYEICVASLRGLNNLDKEVDTVKFYFSDLSDIETASDFEDATILLSYCSSAIIHYEFKIDKAYIHDLSKRLVAKLESALEKTEGITVKCILMECRAQAAVLQFLKSEEASVDDEGLFNWWEKLLETVKDAPLFPIERFSNVVSIMTPYLGLNPRFDKITSQIDELLSKRVGGFAAAEKARDRAIAFYDNQNVIQAIEHLHKVKINWLAAETLRGGILSILFLSQCYSQLGLTYAAKYYALTAAFLAFHTDKENIRDLISRSIFYVAESNYYSGDWLSYLQAMRVALLTHQYYDKAPLDFGEHDSLQRVFYYTMGLRVVTSRFWPQLTYVYLGEWNQWALDPTTRAVIEDIAQEEFKDSFWHTASLDEFWNMLNRDIAGRPFGDIGPARKISWKALGISWNAEFENKFELTKVAEEFIAVLQIVLADIARHDLGIIPLDVLINISLADDKNFVAKEISTNQIITWNIKLPKFEASSVSSYDERSSNVLGIVTAILSHCTTLPSEQFLSKIHEILKQGLFGKTFYAKPYPEVYSNIYTEEVFSEANRIALPAIEPLRSFQPKEHPNLSWNNKPGVNFSEEEALQHIKNRYTRMQKLFSLLWPNFLKSPQHMQYFHALHLEGYRDWHIMTIACNAVTNYYTAQTVHGGNSEQDYLNQLKKVTEEIFNGMHAEKLGQIDVEKITITDLKMNDKMSFVSIMRTWGLSIQSDAPNINALKRFMVQRYKLFELDQPHDKIIWELNNVDVTSQS